MPDSTHEQTLNVALGEALDSLRRSWHVRAERTGNVLEGGGRPDVLVEDASGWPVVIEAERTDHASAEQDAKARLGKKVSESGKTIETAIALVYPDELTYLDGGRLRNAVDRTDAFEYALYTHRVGEQPERLPEQGWIRGGVRDLAMLAHRAAAPAPRVEALADRLQTGVERAADEFTRRHAYGVSLGREVAGVLRQADDTDGQTRRMAMTVIPNALIFHESLAEAGFQVPDLPRSSVRTVRPVGTFRSLDAFAPDDLCDEWLRILEVNYWPIFWTAKEMLALMPAPTANGVLTWLWPTARDLVHGGVTRSHDLTGIVFQKLIADRKFLATYYTRPEAATLLAGLALPADRAPGGADWGDGETLAGLQVGDFACGTGTLLSAAYQRLSLLHELHGGDPRALHAPMMKHGLVGLDVVNIAVHLTAAMLAGSHPDTPFDGECLLTMPYGDRYFRPNGNGNGSGKPKEAVTVGSLDLLAESVQPGLLGDAAAVTSGGRKPEEVRDLVSRVGHGKFDLVIMNPPFVRPTGMEGGKIGSGNPAFAAFRTSREVQRKMQDSLVQLRGGDPIASGNAGLAADFLELALRKARPDGTVALVLPLSAVSGIEWEDARQAVIGRCSDITVVTIAGAGSYDASFSADTGMAECLLIAKRGASEAKKRATFIVLRRQVHSAQEAGLLAAEIGRIRESNQATDREEVNEKRAITIGEQEYGVILNFPLPESGPWPLVGIADEEIADVAWNLRQGRLVQLNLPDSEPVPLPIAPIGQIADRGPYHADIYWENANGTPRGPFVLRKLSRKSYPTYPVLWGHDTEHERQFIVSPDTQGSVKGVSPSYRAVIEQRARVAVGSTASQDALDAEVAKRIKEARATLRKKAKRILSTATRAHYNRDLQFNAQSLIVAMTERLCIGGHAWPSVIFENPEHEYAFALWCNSTLGLLLHWWSSNKTQSGRGRTTVTGIPNIPTLDTRALTPEQHAAAKAAFEAMRERRFLPFDQVDEDPARAELDRCLLVDVLGLPESLCTEHGPLDLLRRKLAREPQIHGGKKSRVVFDEAKDVQGNVVLTERSERRNDR